MSEYNTATADENTFTLDLSDIPDPSEIPAGNYDLEITKFTPSRNDPGAVQRINIDFVADIADGSQRGVSDSFRLDRGRDRKRLKSFVTIISVDGNGGALSEADFVGKKVSAFVVR